MTEQSPSKPFLAPRIARQPWHKSLPIQLLLWLLIGSAAQLLVMPFLFSIWSQLGIGKAISQWMWRSGVWPLPDLAGRIRLLALSVPDWTAAVLIGTAIGRYVQRWPIKNAIACSLGFTFASDVFCWITISLPTAPAWLSPWLLIPRLFTIALLVASAAYMSRGRPDPKTHCVTCGYNLTANVSGICPECGNPIPEH